MFIIVLTLGLSSKLVSVLKVEEENKVKEFAKAQELLSNHSDKLTSESRTYLIEFLSKNNSVPVLLLDEEFNYIDSRNIDDYIVEDTAKLNRKIAAIMASKYPIVMKISGENQYIYFENSKILDRLQLYPVVVVLVLLSFAFFFIAYSNSLKNAEQNNLWAGMAKETAHQIGTPLSSIMGWTELLKNENINPFIVVELEKDIERLKVITNRFSKIGSREDLKPDNIVQVVKSSIDYLEHRLSKKIKLNFSYNKEEILVNLNPILISWVVENLLKNSVDAIQNDGRIDIIIKEQAKEVEILVKDNGTGISKANLNKIFSPGFTTKKRGWGLGLSLARRIVEDYHKGEISVNSSTPEGGTEIKIILAKYVAV